MRIVLASDIFPPQNGGPATYVVALANELIESGHEVRVITLNYEADESKVNCPLLKVPKKGKFIRYFWYLDRLTALAKWGDIVYAMGPVNAGLPALIAAKLRQIPFVVKVVGDYAWEQGVGRFDVVDGIDEFQSRKKYVWQVRALKKLESFVVRHADKVVVPSEYLRRIVSGWGAEDAKIITIYNAVKFLSVEKIEKSGAERWLVFVGRLVAWKGVDTLINIMPRILAVYPNTKLKIVGDGPLMTYLDHILHMNELEDSVELLGALPRPQALRYVASADLFLLNTGYEGLSHVALEAMSYGVPVLASGRGGNPEIVISGKTGELFEYDDREWIVETILKSLAENTIDTGWTESGVGKMFFDQFRYETMMRETVKLLEEECKKG
jgi:glycosyltransferase involved in cell wall biosynthesis